MITVQIQDQGKNTNYPMPSYRRGEVENHLKRIVNEEYLMDKQKAKIDKLLDIIEEETSLSRQEASDKVEEK